MSELLFKDESYRIMGACFDVYNHMGCGFLEAVYHECLEREFSSVGIPFQSRVQLPVIYKGAPLDRYYEADFICFDQIVLEIKADSELSSGHASQVLNYLSATGFQLGILVNFGSYPKLQYKRLAHSQRH